MKKIGILTTYFATNYGAMLQPFALKRTLENLGYEVELIRYKQPKVYSVYEPITKDKLIHSNGVPAVRYILRLPKLLKKKHNFMCYMKKYLQPQMGFANSISKDKDYYFFGSDQIWNPTVTGGFDDVYFGYFPVKPGARKISYAASAEDIDYNKDNCEYLTKALSNFDMISVREKKLAEDLKRVTGHTEIEVTVDPTLLADKNVFKEIEHINPLPGKRFVLFYKIRNCTNFTPKIYEYATKIGAELLVLSAWYDKDIVTFQKSHKGVTYLPEAGVEYFLGAIQNAEMVFTPSFHGCVFPILYHKPFYSLVLSDTWNNRANDLLTSIELDKRLLRIDGVITEERIDYEKVDKLLETRRNQSMDFVLRALQ